MVTGAIRADQARRDWNQFFSEQFQEKCEALFRPQLCKNKSLERFCVSVKSGTALGN
jgi:hypothetical protein